MTRVTLLTTSLGFGGADAQIAQCATALRKRGWEMSVVSLVAPTAFTAELSAAGVPVRSLDMRPGRVARQDVFRLIRYLRELRPQILHSHMFHANLAARAIRLLCPVPIVISHLHSVAESSRENPDVRLRDRVYRFTDPLSDLVIAVSREVAERHLGQRAVRAGKLRVIPNCVDTSRYRPDGELRERTRRALAIGPRFAWLAAGRLMWKKDYMSLLRAFPAGDEAVLLLAGEGPDGERLRQLAAELSVNVQFLGVRDDMPALMNAADGFVHSSLVEGLPLVLLEAAASGLPAVATAAGGARECIAEGETGFVVPCSDGAALRAGMERLSSLPAAERVRMGEAARRRAHAKFGVETVIIEWERTYRELLGWA
ncbi:MAG: glycosyltransferase [Candidatus Solibacter sp.]